MPHQTPYEKTRIRTHPLKKLQIRSQILQAVNGNLTGIINFARRIQNNSISATDNIFIGSSKLEIYFITPVLIHILRTDNSN
jgi:hypothetical protein